MSEKGTIYDKDETKKYIFSKLDEINEYLGKKHSYAFVIDIGNSECLPFFEVLDSDEGEDREERRKALLPCVEALKEQIRDNTEWYDKDLNLKP